MPYSAPATGGNTALYAEIQQFYAHQMHLLDGGDADAWAQTFTPDGVFAANAHPQPAVGRETIRAAASKVKAQHAEEGLQVRHWLGMMDITEQPDGSVLARTYALIINTPRGGQAAVSLSTTCDDLLVRDENGAWLVADRKVVRDDLR
ncbi:nuclear transport factor 2 family protein [Streptomyces sp. SL13]|uniref:Nuclear transport factor 2 family protein n=1 Tax=Streptantibioticus silvisoli TaxID=2705255 RepID=A0AA90H7H9_9ACTN|nr:nuclear transport factor 2 family protein [Streptantibioticus silvisoli]MDI5967327.1 nuclear transport factor 2 family protein [Streptantibioticus silvisoli]MDI5972646.1 nuclear transport factor 2 family protein [Streptantibioticus silvisoli]